MSRCKEWTFIVALSDLFHTSKMRWSRVGQKNGLDSGLGLHFYTDDCRNRRVAYNPATWRNAEGEEKIMLVATSR